MSEVNHTVVELELKMQQTFLRQYEEDVIRARKEMNEAEYRMNLAAAHRDAVSAQIAKLTALLDA